MPWNLRATLQRYLGGLTLGAMLHSRPLGAMLQSLPLPTLKRKNALMQELRLAIEFAEQA